MSIATIGMIIFFGVIGLELLISVPSARIIEGIAALVIAIALILGR